MRSIQGAPLVAHATPLAILSEGCFGEIDSKTATGVIRYGEWPIAAVIDSTRAGKSVREVTGMPCDAPVVSSLQDALACDPSALLLGIAPSGGVLPESYRKCITQALQNGLHIINGLHWFLKDDPEFVALAARNGAVLWDVRNCSQDPVVARKRPRSADNSVITLVGSDCCVGKMCTALELHRGARAKGVRSSFVATGQTGILITGNGVPLDRVIGDFMAGHVERCIVETIEATNPAWIFVEGQGSLAHPAYSGVTLSLIHGSNPDAMVLCHRAGREWIDEYPSVSIPSLSTLIEIYESAASWTNDLSRKCRVAAIALNTSGYSDEQAAKFIEDAQRETGLPTTDPVRYGVEAILNALERSLLIRATIGRV